MNKDTILFTLRGLNYKLGCWDSTLNKLNKTNLKKVLDNIPYANDTKVFINRKPYIVQIDLVDNEIDFNAITLKEYNSMYDTWED